MKQFITIFRFEFGSYLKNKIFVGVTLALIILIAGITFFPRVSESLNTGDEDSDESKAVMLIVADEDTDKEAVLAAFSAAFPGYTVNISEEEIGSVRDKIASGEVACAFELDGYTSFKYYVNNLSMYDANSAVATGVLESLYKYSIMISAGLTPEEANAIMNAPVTGETVNLGKDQAKNFIYTYIMIFALYMVIMLYGQLVATSVATEKNSRAMELLITSAKPVNMMFGKVLASGLAGLAQIVLVFGSSLLFFNINKDYWGGNSVINSIFAIPGELLAYMLLFFVLGFLMYAFMFGAIGSTASKIEDINTSVLPLTMVLVIAFVAVMFHLGSGNVDNGLMKFLSYFPLTSPMAMFTRIAMGSVPFYGILISVVLLAGSVFGIGVLSAKIYRVGVLLYGTPPKLTSIIKSIIKA